MMHQYLKLFFLCSKIYFDKKEKIEKIIIPLQRIAKEKLGKCKEGEDKGRVHKTFNPRQKSLHRKFIQETR